MIDLNLHLFWLKSDIEAPGGADQGASSRSAEAIAERRLPRL